MNKRYFCHLFQSTPSVGRATKIIDIDLSQKKSFQSTPSVGRATKSKTEEARQHNISIHALRGEGDARGYHRYQSFVKFQSTPSVGRATLHGVITKQGSEISIHALRGEGDEQENLTLRSLLYISIHALRGEGD